MTHVVVTGVHVVAGVNVLPCPSRTVLWRAVARLIRVVHAIVYDWSRLLVGSLGDAELCQVVRMVVVFVIHKAPQSHSTTIRASLLP
jgi:hypothetical protein